MKKLITWVKSNIPASVLVIILAILAFGGTKSPRMFDKAKRIDATNTMYQNDQFDQGAEFYDMAITNTKIMPPSEGMGFAPELNIQNRLLVTNSYLSLLVQSVREAIDTVSEQVKDLGGFVVSSDINTPEGLSTGSVTVRVPADKLDSMLGFLREYGVKVVSENIMGTDITEQYIDMEKQIQILEGTKAKYEEILKATNDIEQILLINDRIIGIQSQIDSYKGQMEYMKKTAESSLITVYLSTDELELPFAPEERWDAQLIFKYAVRSLVQTGRDVAGSVIWIGVYAVIWLPLLVIGWVVKKKLDKKA